MNNSKLLQLIKALSPTELRRFNKFVRSPYHNEHTKTTLLWQYIYKTAPRFLHTRLTRERIFTHIYPQKSYDDVQMRLLMSYLYKVLENFLAIEKLKDNDIKMRINLLEQYRVRGLVKQFESTRKQTATTQKKSPVNNADYYYYQFRIEQSVNQMIEQQQNRNVEPNLQQLTENLDTFYLIHKLKYACASLNYKNISQADYHLPLLTEIMQCLEKHPSSNPIVKTYRLALLTLTNSDNEANFEQLKRQLLEHAGNIAKSDLQDLFVLARNYCIKRINMGDNKYVLDLFTLYRHEIKEELLLNNGQISPAAYKNVVAAGLMLKNFDWTEQFIKQYKEKLASEFRHNGYLLNLARLHFALGKHREVVALLHEIDPEELFTSLSAKAMLLRTYYELDEQEALYSLVDSFTAFLKRKKIIAYHRTPYLNFIKYVRKLVKLEFATTASLQKLKADILENPKVVDKGWLLEKVERLIV